jgi:MFS family permease
MNHTCNLLPRIQAEGVGPAIFLGRRLAKVLALGFLAAILGLLLSWLSDNPFALTFQAGAVLIAAGLMVPAIAALMMLFRSRRLLARIVAVSCIVVGLLSVFLVGILAAKNRILWRSRLTKESWQQDVRYLSNLIVRAHPNAFAHVSQDIYDQ